MRIGKAFYALLVLLGAGTSLRPSMALAQADPEIRTRVSAEQITLNDSLTLSLEISGVQNVQPPWPLNIPGFNVQRAGRTQSFQFVNGQTSSLITFNYALTPVQTGELAIPSISLTHDGKTLTTQPIRVMVSAGTAAAPTPQTAQTPAGDPDIPAEGLKPVFMTAKVDKSKAFVGEQILLTVKFLRRPHVRLAAQPQYAEPEMTGFIVENLSPKEYQTSIQGAPYHVTELRYALFPTSDGDFAIGNASIQLAVRQEPDPFDPNSFFESFFGRNQSLRLNTRAIPIRVRSLPVGKPSQFSGAVGRFQMTAKTDTKEFEVGKPFNLEVTIKGVGNIQAVKEPFFQEPSSFKKYETIAETTLDRDGDYLSGTKKFKILMIPQVSGILTLPKITFDYFDPKKNEYETDESGPFQLTVQTGNLASGASDQNLSSNGQRSPEESIRVLERDIRFIKAGELPENASPLYGHAFFIVGLALPPVFALGAGLAGVWSRRKSLYAADYQARGAFGASVKQIKRLAKKSGTLGTEEFYQGVSTAITGYLSAKFRVSRQGITWEWLEGKLKETGCSEETRFKVKSILEEADQARFAPSTFDEEQRPGSLARARETLDDLKEVLG